MRELRLKALEHYEERPLPKWGGAVEEIDFQDIHYFVRASEERDEDSWDDVPQYIRDTYDKLGIPEAEKNGLLAGVGAQYDSEVVYHSIREDLEKLGVLFMSTDQAPAGARGPLPANTSPPSSPPTTTSSPHSTPPSGPAAPSSGSPRASRSTSPCRPTFRINSEDMGQFERTMIIAEPGSKVHYVEGCTGPHLLQRLAAQRRRPRSSPSPARTSATPPFKTGPTTSTTSSPSAPPPTRTPR